jgi:hypothetical protein
MKYLLILNRYRITSSCKSLFVLMEQLVSILSTLVSMATQFLGKIILLLRL